MLFQSQFYVLIFLPPVAAVYYLCAESAVKRRWVLIAASLVFYAWWDLRFVVLPVGQSCSHGSWRWRANAAKAARC
jgi:alginate O-acetyltransferase complex protein AlgI